MSGLRFEVQELPDGKVLLVRNMVTGESVAMTLQELELAVTLLRGQR